MSFLWLIQNVWHLFDDFWLFCCCELLSLLVFSYFLSVVDDQGVNGISEIGAVAKIIGADRSKWRHIVIYGYLRMSAQETKNWYLPIRCCFARVFDWQCVFDWIKMTFFWLISYFMDFESSVRAQIRVWRIQISHKQYLNDSDISLGSECRLTQKNIRKISIIAHVDHDKAALTESLTHVHRDVGEEKEHGITIESAAVSIPTDLAPKKKTFQMFTSFQKHQFSLILDHGLSR